MKKEDLEWLAEFREKARQVKAHPKIKRKIFVGDQTCMYVSKFSSGNYYFMSFSHAVWEALEAPKYIECYWYGDALVLVPNTSGFFVSLNNLVRNRDDETFKGRFHVHARVLFDSIVSQWQLEANVGCVYSGGSFETICIEGRPAVMISRTPDDYYQNKKESVGGKK